MRSMSKASDRTWHEGLIYKVKCSAVSGELLTLIHNFLTNRQQRVVLNGKCLQWVTISAGVLQGSVLGPLVVLIYINHTTDNIPCDIKLSADDTSIYDVRNDNSREELKRDLERLCFW